MLKVTPCSIRETHSSRIRRTGKKEERSPLKYSPVLKVQGLSRSSLILNAVVSVYRSESYLLDTDGGNIVRPAGTQIPETRQKAGRPVTECLEYLTTQSLAHSFTSFCCSRSTLESHVVGDTPARNPDSASGEFLLTGIIRFVDHNLRPQIEVMIFYSPINTV